MLWECVKWREQLYNTGVCEMNANLQNLGLAPAVVDTFQTAYARVKLFMLARRLWERVLSEDDKLQLGWDLHASYERLGTARMWMETHHVSFTRAVVEVAREIGFLDEPAYSWLSREIGYEPPQPGKHIHERATPWEESNTPSTCDAQPFEYPTDPGRVPVATVAIQN